MRVNNSSSIGKELDSQFLHSERINKNEESGGGFKEILEKELPVRILWFSRHEPKPEEIEELRKIYGDIDLIQKHKSISHGSEVVQLMEDYGCDEVFVVLPMKRKEEIIQLGVNPIQAVMNRVKLKGKKVRFDFQYFEKLKRADIERERL